MGNELSSGGNIKTSILGKYVKDFMINKYEYKPGEIFTNLLKKRACCRNTTEVPIAIPSVDSVTKKIYPSIINIKIFEKKTDITDNACTFENSSKYRPENPDKGKNWIAGNTCKNFYGKFCNNVYDNRKASYTNIFDYATGPFPDDPVVNPPNLADLNVGNQYLDCNCLNSVYVRSPDKFETSIPLLPDEMAQNKDTRCANNPPDGAFINKWSQKENLTFCVNSVNITGGVVATNASSIGISQSCNASSNNSKDTKTPTSEPSVPPTSAPPTSAPPKPDVSLSIVAPKSGITTTPNIAQTVSSPTDIVKAPNISSTTPSIKPSTTPSTTPSITPSTPPLITTPTTSLITPLYIGIGFILFLFFCYIIYIIFYSSKSDESDESDEIED